MIQIVSSRSKAIRRPSGDNGPPLPGSRTRCLPLLTLTRTVALWAENRIDWPSGDQRSGPHRPQSSGSLPTTLRSPRSLANSLPESYRPTGRSPDEGSTWRAEHTCWVRRAGKAALSQWRSRLSGSDVIPRVGNPPGCRASSAALAVTSPHHRVDVLANPAGLLDLVWDRGRDRRGHEPISCNQ